MYLVTLEDNEGMWMDDPKGYDTEEEARKAAAEFPSPTWTVCIYRCDLLAVLSRSPQESGHE